RGPTIRVPQLKQLLANKISRTGWFKEGKGSLVLLDAAYTLREPANHDEFLRKHYGLQFADRILQEAHSDYLKCCLPGAAHFNLDIASYPGKYERASLYPPALFGQYIMLLNVDKGDSVVEYGRGHSGGMLFAARAWWLLKMYGMRDVAVLEGGHEKWKEEGGETTSGVEQLEGWHDDA
ncbi:hypothetical protein PENTCL1PPCAC_9276, partial [Pristionchus entomophagus]